MCFSAEASFTSSAVLALIGYASIKAAPSKSKLFLAAIPCFFALQQFSEGIIWLNLRGDIAPSFLTLAAQILFLFFFVFHLTYLIFSAISILTIAIINWLFLCGWMDGCVSAALSRISSSTKQYRGLVPKANMLSKFGG